LQILKTDLQIFENNGIDFKTIIVFMCANFINVTQAKGIAAQTNTNGAQTKSPGLYSKY